MFFYRGTERYYFVATNKIWMVQEDGYFNMFDMDQLPFLEQDDFTKLDIISKNLIERLIVIAEEENDVVSYLKLKKVLKDTK
jgi:hypothetical protein